METPRLVLVEWLNTDRFSQLRSQLYPFLQGLALARQVPVRWLCFGFDPIEQFDSVRALTPAEQDVEQLATMLTEHRATHVMCNERLTDGADQRLRANRPHLQWHDRDDALPTDQALLEWLGLPVPDRSQALPDAAKPSYLCELVNERARSAKPLVAIVGGPQCIYARDVSRLPAFAGVELDLAPERRRGCSFCGRTVSPLSIDASPVALALLQIDRVINTANTSRHTREFDIQGAPVFLRIGELLDGILAAEYPASAFYLSARIDEILARASHIEAALPGLKRAGHIIHFANVGLENLSAVENERLNKNISKAQVADFMELIRNWSRDWPTTVAFEEHGGFGFIMFTPWTTIADLRENASALRELDIPHTEFCVASRLLLVDGRPIAALARHHDLVTNEFPDPVVATFSQSGCLTDWGQREIPWRFAHAEVALIYSLVLRRRPDSIPDTDDPVAEQVRQICRLSRDWHQDPVLFLEALLDVVEAGITTVPAALERLAVLAERSLPPRARPSHTAGLLVALDRLLGDLARRADRPLAGFATTTRIDHHADPEITLTRGDQRLLIRLSPRATTAKAFLFAGEFALVHASETPVDTPDKERAIFAIARALDPLASRRRTRAARRR